MILTPKNSYIRRKEMNSVLDCLVEDFARNGSFRSNFLKQAKELFSFDYGIAFRSPVDALAHAFACCDIKPGDKIALSALDPYWTEKAVRSLGAEPLWLDVDDASGTLTEQELQKAVRDGAKTIYVRHHWGIMPNPAVFEGISVPILEDISGAYGAWSAPAREEIIEQSSDTEQTETETETVPADARFAGSIGTFVLLGLEPGDYFTAGGGMLLYAKSRRDAQILRNKSEDLPEEILLGDMNAALASAQLFERNRMQKRRKDIMDIYRGSLARSHHKTLVQTAEGISSDSGCIVIATTSVKEIVQYAKKKEVETAQAFGQSCIARGLLPEGCCPKANALSHRTIAFPLYPGINKTQASKIAKVLATMP